ncbi:nematocyst expressed protein 3-like [Schistocerca serialis cubense]|uniref:nematocyst expressed protein 3-like n=1 Tax=Schistocerca serialis cubense TaxID=2023355 RepID=UPI00214E4747|nr:nematocyst expressed protein 3-like [Schistocerca serialis cubense]
MASWRGCPVYQKALKSSRPPKKKPRTNRPPPPLRDMTNYPVLRGQPGALSSAATLVAATQAPDGSVAPVPLPAQTPTTSFAAAARSPPHCLSSVTAPTAHQLQEPAAAPSCPSVALSQPSAPTPTLPTTTPAPARRRGKQTTRDPAPVVETDASFLADMCEILQAVIRDTAQKIRQSEDGLSMVIALVEGLSQILL